MSRIVNDIKSFFHSLSTQDHYASYDPSRPVNDEGSAPLTNAPPGSGTDSDQDQYRPGMLSSRLQDTENGTEEQIPLEDSVPVPNPQLSWNRIDQWIESNYPELYDQLQYGATANDLNELEKDICTKLPKDVRDSFLVHDGQEQGGKPTGVFFGITLLDLESVSEEWTVWKRAEVHLNSLKNKRQAQASQAQGEAQPKSNGSSQLPLEQAQQSCPPDAVQRLYTHSKWIPLAKDFNGNNIAIDMAPGPKGRVGQVILFGHDFDTKFVVAPSWGDFLAQFAADLESGNSYIDDDIEEAVFAFKSPSGQLVSYFNVLRSRIQRLYPPTRKPQPQPHPHRAPQPRSNPNANPPKPSVSHAPVNSGRLTQRLTSPPMMTKPRTKKHDQFKEVDISDIPTIKTDHEKEAGRDTEVKAKAERKSKSEEKAEPKPDEKESKPESEPKIEDLKINSGTPESETEAKETKEETKEEPKQESKQEPKQESKEESKQESKPESKPESQLVESSSESE